MPHGRRHPQVAAKKRSLMMQTVCNTYVDNNEHNNMNNNNDTHQTDNTNINNKIIDHSNYKNSASAVSRRFSQLPVYGEVHWELPRRRGVDEDCLDRPLRSEMDHPREPKVLWIGPCAAKWTTPGGQHCSGSALPAAASNVH